MNVISRIVGCAIWVFCGDWRWRRAPISVLFLFPLVMHGAYKESREEKKRPTGRSPHHTNKRTNTYTSLHMYRCTRMQKVSRVQELERVFLSAPSVCVRENERIRQQMCVGMFSRYPHLCLSPCAGLDLVQPTVMPPSHCTPPLARSLSRSFFSLPAQRRHEARISVSKPYWLGIRNNKTSSETRLVWLNRIFKKNPKNKYKKG